MSFQVADHVRLPGDGDRAHDAVVMGHVSPRGLEEVHMEHVGDRRQCFMDQMFSSGSA